MYNFAIAAGTNAFSSNSPALGVDITSADAFESVSPDELISYWRDKFNNVLSSLGSRFGRTTSGSEERTLLYAPTLPSNEHITCKAMDYAYNLPASRKRNIAILLLTRIYHVIFSDDYLRENIPFTQIGATEMEDGTLLLEWMYRFGRVNFFIDNEANESSVVFLTESLNSSLPLSYGYQFGESSIDLLARIATFFVARLA